MPLRTIRSKGYGYNAKGMECEADLCVGRQYKNNRPVYTHRNWFTGAFEGGEWFVSITPMDPEPDSNHAYHLYTPLLDVEKIGKSRDWALSAMTAENIGTGVHYLPVHLHPYYRKTFGWRKGDFPNAEWIGERTISLPLSTALNDEDVEDVIMAFTKILSRRTQVTR